ncbi:hypothetical protein CK910_22780 [Aeromonas sp. CA23]|uniref:opacity family porin n=1 Tax=Aeromonas sp. CA23 TaxID=2033032 RepID=UPI000BFE5D2B|nr:opacity family porin [Aeromonas sp. CA23]ATM00989.1 hypothetical protein CK910_22780 [Aeromonas sp. CA23]
MKLSTVVSATALSAMLLLAGLSSVQASSQSYLQKGTHELNVQGAVDFDADDKYKIDLNGKYGYFVMQGWEVGTNVITDMSKSYKSGGIGIFTEYNFVNSTNFVPYVGIGTELMRANYNDKRDDKLDTESFNSTAMNFKTNLGGKYFISPNVALTAEVNYNVATDHFKVYGGDAKNSFTKFFIGTSFYF